MVFKIEWAYAASGSPSSCSTCGVRRDEERRNSNLVVNLMIKISKRGGAEMQRILRESRDFQYLARSMEAVREGGLSGREARSGGRICVSIWPGPAMFCFATKERR